MSETANGARHMIMDTSEPDIHRRHTFPDCHNFSIGTARRN